MARTRDGTIEELRFRLAHTEGELEVCRKRLLACESRPGVDRATLQDKLDREREAGQIRQVKLVAVRRSLEEANAENAALKGGDGMALLMKREKIKQDRMRASLASCRDNASEQRKRIDRYMEDLGDALGKLARCQAEVGRLKAANRFLETSFRRLARGESAEDILAEGRINADTAE